FHLAELTTEQLVRDLDQTPVRVVGPAVIGAGQRAARDLANRELHVAMGAAVLERTQRAVCAAEYRDRAAPEFDLDNAAGRHALVVLDRVPMVGVHPGGAGFLSRISRAGKGGRPSRVRTGGPHFHETVPSPAYPIAAMIELIF